MNQEELLERFRKHEAQSRKQSIGLILSDDGTLGIPIDWNEDDFVLFGVFKFKRRVQGALEVTKDFYLRLSLLYRAMFLLRRRKRFTLGTYHLGNGWVFALREKDCLLLMAPMEPYQGYEEVKLKDFVERVNKNKLETWEKWSMILRSPKGDGS